MNKTHRPNPTTSHAVVLTFPDHLTQAQCDDILMRMHKAGYCKADYEGKAPTCRAFNPDHGSPVFYIP